MDRDLGSDGRIEGVDGTRAFYFSPAPDGPFCSLQWSFLFAPVVLSFPHCRRSGASRFPDNTRLLGTARRTGESENSGGNACFFLRLDDYLPCKLE